MPVLECSGTWRVRQNIFQEFQSDLSLKMGLQKPRGYRSQDEGPKRVFVMSGTGNERVGFDAVFPLKRERACYSQPSTSGWKFHSQLEAHRRKDSGWAGRPFA